MSGGFVERELAVARGLASCRGDDARLDEADAEIAKLRAERDALRMQLVACGVVALANTPESATNAREMHPDYRSASCDDVARAVDREMALRAERNALREVLELAVESGCATVFADEYDECGDRGCCGVVSYKPHADDCWVTKARAAIDAAREKK